MIIIINIVISIVFYFILMFLSTTLLGMLVRGFFTDPEIERLKSEGIEVVKQEIRKFQNANKWLSISSFLLIIAYLYATWHFWNIGVAGVALVLILTRLPDLLWEIKNGKKITNDTMPKNALNYILVILDWIALPALYYFLYHF